MPWVRTYAITLLIHSKAIFKLKIFLLLSLIALNKIKLEFYLG